MSQNDDADFAALPWYTSISSDPQWRLIPTLSTIVDASTTENSLVAQTLNNPTGIRASQTYITRMPGSAPPELLMFISLGTGVNGFSDTCHGGLIALLLDEVTGQLASKAFGRNDCLTAGLNIGFKRKLSTPRVVLCRAWIKDRQLPKGRKVTVEATVEDGEGGVFATGEAVYVTPREKI